MVAPRYWMFAALLAWAGASSAFAQTGRPAQDGHALDANRRVGSGGYNVAHPPYTELNAANRYITGNVTGLGSFRGYSPIADPSQFRTGLGSAGLTFFNRRGVSLGDVTAGQSAAGLPFYSRAQTIVGAGGIRSGLNAPGSSTPLSTYVPPVAGRFGTPRDSSPYAVTADDLRRQGQALALRPVDASGAPVYSRYDARDISAAMLPYVYATQSSMFGVGPYSAPPAEAEPLAESRGLPFGEARGIGQGVGESDNRAAGRVGDDLFSQIQSVTQRGGGTGVDPVAAQARGRLAARVGASPKGAIGELLARASARVTGEMQTTSQQRAAGVGQLETSARLSKAILETPLASFARGAPNTLNALMSAGENAMKAGRYYDAANLFAQAESMDPENPLPALARGHALAAAGEYLSASTQIQKGVRLYPRIAALAMDLTKLMGDAEVCRVRIADLTKLLASSENAELRFLLGYAQYYSGNVSDGVENLVRAARRAVPDSVIARFPELLLGEDSSSTP